MVPKAISKMKSGKAAGPSRIIIEMIKAVGDGVTVCLTSLFNHIFIHRQSTRWLASIIHHQYFQRKRRCFILWKLEFGFMPARGTTDAIFIIRQLQKNYLQMKENNYFASVDLEKAFDHVPQSYLMGNTETYS